MMHKLKETNWNEILASEDVNYMYDTFTAKLTNIYNTICPVTVTKQKLIRKMPDKPWMTNSLKQACKKKKSDVYFFERTDQLLARKDTKYI